MHDQTSNVINVEFRQPGYTGKHRISLLRQMRLWRTGCLVCTAALFGSTFQYAWTEFIK